VNINLCLEKKDATVRRFQDKYALLH